MAARGANPSGVNGSDIPELPPAWPGAQIYTPAARIFVRRSGRSEAPSLMLLHGWGVHGGMFEGPMRGVLEPHFQLLVPDLRGHGYSSTPRRAHTWRVADFVDDLVRSLDHLGVDRVHAAGYSLGGFVALALAEAHPDRVDRLSLICAQGRYPNKARRNLAWAEAAFKVLPPQTMAWVSDRLLAGPGVPDELRPVMRWLLAYNTRGGISGAAAAMRHGDLSHGLADLPHETLLVTAEHDVAVSRRATRQLLESIPRITHRHFEDAGHALAASHGAELARALVDFFAVKAP